jgi:peptidoglycan/LPS O-acetylase OafA/YrhL
MLNKKDISLDGVRGLAALIVFLTHFLAAFKPNTVFGSAQLSELELFYKTPLGLITAGNFAVCLFFTLSGYVLSVKHFTNKTQDVDVYGDILKRYIRLGIPLALTCFLSFFIYKGGFYYNHQVAVLLANDWFRDYFNTLEDKNYFSFFQEILFQLFFKAQDYNPPAWTIGTELLGSYLTFGILVVARKAKIHYRFGLYLILFLLLCGNHLQNFILGLVIADARINYNHIEGKMAIVKNNRILFYLTINCLFIFSLLLASFPYYVPQRILISSSSFYNVFIFLDNRDIFGGGITMISSFLFFVTYRYTIYKVWLETKLMQILGQYSFMLYLTHFLSLCSVTSLVYLKTINKMSIFANLFLTFGMYVFSTILMTLVMAKIADFPAIRIGNQLKLFYLNSLDNQKIP